MRVFKPTEKRFLFVISAAQPDLNVRYKTLDDAVQRTFTLN